MSAVVLADTTLRKEAQMLASTGTVLLPAGIVFNTDEIDDLATAIRLADEDRVTAGDADDKHDLYVSRFLLNNPGEVPRLSNGGVSDKVLFLLSDDTRTAFFSNLLGLSKPVIRRCQSHRMVSGSFIGRHLDAESDPDFDYAVTIQLGRSFSGGAFVVYPANQEAREYYPKFGDVLVTTCHFEHEVLPVTQGERRTLVYFYSIHAGANRRAASRQ